MAVDSFSMQQLAEFFGVTRQTVHDWVVNRGCPRGGDGTFDLKNVLRWYRGFAAEDVVRHPKRYGLAKIQTAHAVQTSGSGRVMKIEADGLVIFSELAVEFIKELTLEGKI